MNLNDLGKLHNRRSRSITPENPTGERGKGGMCGLEEGVTGRAARDLGVGWKVNPYIVIPPHSVVTIADIAGEGEINHIWLTPTGVWRYSILRIYWDGQEQPSVQSPIGDFFCLGWDRYAQLSSLPVCVNPGSALNCFWTMPFKKSCRMTLENISDEAVTIFYQVDYALCKQPEEPAYFHAQFRRVNPLPYKEVYTILDGISGKGHYVGTFMAHGVNNNGWWGEGEVKFYLDDDGAFPTICGTGTEDYFLGSYNFEDPFSHQDYVAFTTPYAGLHQIIWPNKLYETQFRFGMYRWHITDPICFEQNLKVTIQALGWRDGQRYLPLQDDIASVAYWYQTLPTAPFPPFCTKDELEII